MKAFLSHSTVNSELVRAVADHLGRQYCVCDARSFSSGIEFKESILKGLDDSTAFVFFASSASLKSDWVNFESDEAWHQTLQRKISRSLVVLIESGITHKDLPQWLQRAKTFACNSAKQIARLIRDHLDELLHQQQSPFFIGRTDDVNRYQRTALPSDGSDAPRIIAFTGLPGNGRRSLIRHVSKSTLNLRRNVIIRVEAGDEIFDLTIKLADLVEPFATKDGWASIVESIKKQNDDERLHRAIAAIKLLIKNEELPVFLDQGGLLDDEGRFTEPVRRLLSAFAPSNDEYLYIVSDRRPNMSGGLSIPVITINHLKDDEAKQLVAAFARHYEVKLTPGEISELAQYTGKQPPSCRYAVELARDYGVSLVVKDKNRLVEFRANQFVKLLQKKNLTPQANAILRILAAYSPLPLPALGLSTGVDAEELGKTMFDLINNALVCPDERGLYAIAEPIRDAVAKSTRLLMNSDHLAVAKALKKCLNDEELDGSRLEMSRLLFQSANSAGDAALADGAMFLASDTIQLTESRYHVREYEQAIKFGYDAVALRPRNTLARNLLIRALIQENRWKEANEQIQVYEGIAPLRDVHYIKGFMARKHGDWSEALRWFSLAEKAGRSGAALHREMASCHFHLNQLNEAEKRLERIFAGHGDDRFILDFAVQLATKQGNEALARQRLEALQSVDGESFFQHRLSCVELRFGNLDAALAASMECMNLEPNPSFEMLMQLAMCQIRASKYDEAEETMGRLDQRFKNCEPDVRSQLRAMTALGRKKFSVALGVLSGCSDKGSHFWRRIRIKALDGELKGSAINDSDRMAYQVELEVLTKSVSGVTATTAEAELNTLLESL